MRIRNTVLSCMMLAGAACAIPRAETVARLSDSPVVSGGTYTSGGGLTVAVDVRGGGLTEVCGVWAVSRRQSALTRQAEHEVLGSASVYLGRERVLSNFLYMKQVDPGPTYGGKEAHCTRTDRAWRPADAARKAVIRIPSRVVFRETGGGIGIASIFGGPTIWFRQTGPGAGES